MEKTTMARLLSIVIILATFLIGASQDELLNFAVYLTAGGVASVGIWLQPKSDFGDWGKLTNHLMLSLPLAGLAAISGAVLLYVPGVGLDFFGCLGVVLFLLVPASILEQRLMGTP